MTETPQRKTPTRESFQEAYSHEGPLPWDIGRPQPPFIQVAEQMRDPILDAGCGRGDAALYLAKRGHQVLGIDFIEEPIRLARQRAAERDLDVAFESRDALELGSWTAKFRSVIDCGLFHGFHDENRTRYVAGLAHILEPGGKLFLMTGREGEPRNMPRVSEQEIREAFADGWEIESVEPVEYELNPDFEFPDGPFEEPAKGWFSVIRRTA